MEANLQTPEIVGHLRTFPLLFQSTLAGSSRKFPFASINSCGGVGSAFATNAPLVLLRSSGSGDNALACIGQVLLGNNAEARSKISPLVLDFPRVCLGLFWDSVAD